MTPEKIEGVYLSSNSLLTQLFVHGDFLQTYLVGIVGVDPVGIRSYIKTTFQKDISTNEEVIAFFESPKNRRVLLQDINGNVAGKLQGFEKIHNIEVAFEPLTLDRGVVTPTMKIRRPICTKFFKKEIEKLYNEGSLVKNGNL